MVPDLASSTMRRSLRLASGLVLFTYITAHLINHALGLVSLKTAEAALEFAVEVWSSPPGTVLLYGAFAIHFVLALWSVYERRTFRLPPLELLRIALGFTLPIMLIGHAANTRLAWELFGMPSDYARVVATLWFTDTQGMQLGVMAPGWVHGCLGLHFLLNRRPLYRKLRYVLFAFALLIPVFSGLGFIAMARELQGSTAGAAAVSEYLAPEHAAKRLALAQWRNGLLLGYFGLIGAIFVARAVRNALERGRRHLVTISYPGRTVRVPRGWSVLEASRSFHLPHASMCGGRARCSTCRVRVSAGEKACPPAAPDERAALERIGAPPDVRLACQLRPQGDLSVIPLVRTERPNYRPTAPRRSAEREVVVLYCDFLNRAELAADHMPQDLLYVLTLYIEGLSNAIRAARGTAELHRARQPVRAVRARARPGAGGAPGAAGGRRDRAGDGRAQRAAGPAVELQGDAGGQHPSRPRRGGRDRRIRPAGGDRDRRGGRRDQRAAQGRRGARRGIRDLAGGLCRGRRRSAARRRDHGRLAHQGGNDCDCPVRVSPCPAGPRRRRRWRRARRCSGCGGSERRDGGPG